MPERESGAAPRVPPESFYCIFEFMSSRDGLALKGVELAVYALVYSYSQGKGGCYYGSNAMTAHRAGCSERHAIDVVHALGTHRLRRRAQVAREDDEHVRRRAGAGRGGDSPLRGRGDP